MYNDTPTSRHIRQSSRQYTENALREAARVLDKRMPGITTLQHAEVVPDPAQEDLYRHLNNMSISPREEP